MIRYRLSHKATYVIAITSIYLTVLSILHGYSRDCSTPLASIKDHQTGQKYAFATFLTAGDAEPDETNNYFIATRMLGYQLMHSPKTSTNTSIPFLVMVTPDVRQSQKDRLTLDGAIVTEVEAIAPLQWQYDQGLSWYKDQFTKLRIADLLEYDRIFYLDSDMYITRRIDDIFNDVASVLQDNLNQTKEVDARESTQPSTYLFSGANDLHSFDYGWPPPDTHELNGGCFLIRPSRELFEYYMSVMKMEGKYPPGWAEQALLNYAHRPTGNMPFRRLDFKWNVLLPNKFGWAIENRPATIHMKWFSPSAGMEELTEAFKELRFEMLGYYIARDQQTAAKTW